MRRRRREGKRGTETHLESESREGGREGSYKRSSGTINLFTRKKRKISFSLSLSALLHSPAITPLETGKTFFDSSLDLLFVCFFVGEKKKTKIAPSPRASSGRHQKPFSPSYHIILSLPAFFSPSCEREEKETLYWVSWPYQSPVILMSLGALEPRSVSDGCTDSNTPTISPVAGSTLATEKTAWPRSATVDLLFSFWSSSASERAGRATALS